MLLLPHQKEGQSQVTLQLSNTIFLIFVFLDFTFKLVFFKTLFIFSNGPLTAYC